MVYAVMARRNENIFQPAQFFYFLGVGENGPYLAYRINEEDIYWWKSGECQWNKEQKAIKRLQCAGSKTCGKIIVFTAVVIHMYGPEKPAIMPQPVQPVMHYIHQQ